MRDMKKIQTTETRNLNTQDIEIMFFECFVVESLSKMRLENVCIFCY